MGKVLISKTFLLSKFVYLMQALAIPEHALKKIHQVQLICSLPFLLVGLQNYCYIKKPSGQHFHLMNLINWVKIFQCFKGT